MFMLCSVHLSCICWLYFNIHIRVKVSMMRPAWRTLTGVSVPSRVPQWIFHATTAGELQLSSGTDLRFLHTSGTSLQTPSMEVVLRYLIPLKAPLWESETWKRMTQLSIASNTIIGTMFGPTNNLEQPWLSQVLRNLGSFCYRRLYSKIIL